VTASAGFVPAGIALTPTGVGEGDGEGDFWLTSIVACVDGETKGDLVVGAGAAVDFSAEGDGVGIAAVSVSDFVNSIFAVEVSISVVGGGGAGAIGAEIAGTPPEGAKPPPEFWVCVGVGDGLDEGT